MKTVRVVLFGTNTLAIPSLQALLSEAFIDVVAVVTKPSSKQGRGMRLTRPPITAFVPEKTLLLQPENLDDNFINQFKSLNPDLAVVVEYGKFIPEKLLDIPKLKTWNVHPSLLPLYRGPAPVRTPLLNGDTITGISVILLDNEMDHGPIIAQEEITIEQSDTAITLKQRLAEQSAILLVGAIKGAAQNGLHFTEQNHDAATSTRKFTKDDYELDFKKNARDVINTIRAFTGDAWFTLPNGKRCKVFSARPLQHNKNLIKISCADMAIELTEVLVEGKNKMSGEQFFQGYHQLF